MANVLITTLIAVDIGNARIKLGQFDTSTGDTLPEPQRTLSLDGRRPRFDRIASWLESATLATEKLSWCIGSVNSPAATRLVDWLHEYRPTDRVTLLSAGDLPIDVKLDRPDMVGIDRLLGAVAGNRLREAGRPAIIIDLGTAITVDLVSAEGSFLGGTIMPGIEMSARAMHEFTELLPLIEMSELDAPPPALGASTTTAMQSGLYWLAVGGIRELIDRLSNDTGSEPQVFLTGGAGPAVAELIGRRTRHVPHLTLAGIVLTARILNLSG